MKDEGTRIDFAYVDTTKLFDAVLTEVYFLTPVLPLGGLLVLDDCSFPGLNKLARFIAVHPSYEPYRKHEVFGTHPIQRLLNYVAAVFPRADKLFAPEVVVTNEQLGVDVHCVAFRKVKGDDRHWTWHERF